MGPRARALAPLCRVMMFAFRGKACDAAPPAGALAPRRWHSAAPHSTDLPAPRRTPGHCDAFHLCSSRYASHPVVPDAVEAHGSERVEVSFLRRNSPSPPIPWGATAVVRGAWPAVGCVSPALSALPGMEGLQSRRRGVSGARWHPWPAGTVGCAAMGGAGSLWVGRGAAGGPNSENVGAGGAGAGSGGGGREHRSGGPVPQLGVVHPVVPERSDRAQYHTVMVAIWANVAIAAAKAVAYLATGSSAMLAEFIHSCVDVLNQYLLRLGVLAARRSATADHPYGYSKDLFVWSLIAGVGIFCFGGGVSLVHGINSLLTPGHLENLGAGVAVMLVSLAVEGYSFKVALDTVRADAKQAGMSLLDYIQRGRDPTTTAVLVEDAGSVIGVTVAGLCMWLTHFTQAAVFDAAGSIFVGCLLAGSAAFLIQTNRKLLIGRAMGQEERAQVLDLLRCDPVVAAVYDTKSEELGPGVYRFKAEIEFSGDQIVRRHLDRTGRAATLRAIRDCACDDRALERALREFGKDVISSSGAEIDRIEQEIKRAVKGIRHVDIETDRGRWFRAQEQWPWDEEAPGDHRPEFVRPSDAPDTYEAIAQSMCSIPTGPHQGDGAGGARDQGSSASSGAGGLPGDGMGSAGRTKA